METAVMQPRKKRYTPKFAKEPKYLFTRQEAKSLLGEYAFSLIDQARNSDADLDEVLDWLDSEGVNTEDFEDAALGRIMETRRTGEYVSEEEVMNFLRQR